MSDIRAYEQPGEAGFGDYVQLLKPRVMSLVVFTALVGLLVAPVSVHPVIAFASILFIALGALADIARIDAQFGQRFGTSRMLGQQAMPVEMEIPNKRNIHR